MSEPQLPPPVPQAPQPAFPAPASGQQAPPAYGQPAYTPPTGAYAAGPAGYAGLHGSFVPPAAPVRASSALGIVALVLALIALLVPSVIGGIAGFEVGKGIGLIDPEVLDAPDSIDLSLFAPVREQVLLLEISFWLGTALGLWALVQGIVAIARRRGRGAGIAAVVIAVLAPLLYVTVVIVVLAGGVAAGAITVLS